MPKRIQRRRTAGWRMPENVVYVGRPTRWGNPYVVGRPNSGYRPAADRADAVEMFRKLVAASPTFQAIVRRELGGKDLACWCPLDGQPCHADVLLRVAAGGEP